MRRASFAEYRPWTARYRSRISRSAIMKTPNVMVASTYRTGMPLPKSMEMVNTSSTAATFWGSSYTGRAYASSESGCARRKQDGAWIRHMSVEARIQRPGQVKNRQSHKGDVVLDTMGAESTFLQLPGVLSTPVLLHSVQLHADASSMTGNQKTEFGNKLLPARKCTRTHLRRSLLAPQDPALLRLLGADVNHQIDDRCEDLDKDEHND
jgi:hypothetical protein